MRTAKVRPIAQRVLDPKTRKPLPEHGRRVVLSSYWRRRIADGSVELVEESSAAKKTRRQGDTAREE